MKKRILSAIMIMVMMMCSINTVSAFYMWDNVKKAETWAALESGKRYIENGVGIKIDSEKGVAKIVGIVEGFEDDFVVPEYFKGLPTEVDTMFFLCDVNSKNITLANINEIRDYYFVGCYKVENIFIPKTVKKISELCFRISGVDVINNGGKINVYYEGSKEEWKNIGGADSTLAKYGNVHFNSTGIGKSGSSNSQTKPKSVVHDFTISPKTGYRKDDNYEGTDFTITVTTSKDVKKISLYGDEENGTWFEVTYDNLVKLYDLKYKDSGDKRIWTMNKFKILRAGKERKLRLYTDGKYSGKEVEVEVFAKNVSTSDKIKPDVYSFQCDSKANINRKDVTKIKFKAAAKDNVGVRKIQISVEGVPIATSYGSTVSTTVLTSGLDLGKNEIYAIAYDAAGNMDYSSPIYITVTDGSFSPTPQSGKVTMYAPDGRVEYIDKKDVSAWKKVGWYDYPVAQVYTPDGRTQVIDKNDVAAWIKVGWYTYKGVMMYAPDGRTAYIEKSDVSAWKKVGWYDMPVTTVYARDGRTQVIAKSDVAAWKKVGWYTK